MVDRDITWDYEVEPEPIEDLNGQTRHRAIRRVDRVLCDVYLLRTEWSRDEGRISWFRAMWTDVARVDSPSVPRVIDRGVMNGVPCAVTATAPTRSLETVATSSAPSIEFSLQVTEALLVALLAAHRVDVAHGRLQATRVFVQETPFRLMVTGFADLKHRPSTQVLHTLWRQSPLITDLRAIGHLGARLADGSDATELSAARLNALDDQLVGYAPILQRLTDPELNEDFVHEALRTIRNLRAQVSRTPAPMAEDIASLPPTMLLDDIGQLRPVSGEQVAPAHVHPPPTMPLSDRDLFLVSDDTVRGPLGNFNGELAAPAHLPPPSTTPLIDRGLLMVSDDTIRGPLRDYCEERAAPAHLQSSSTMPLNDQDLHLVTEDEGRVRRTRAIDSNAIGVKQASRPVPWSIPPLSIQPGMPRPPRRATALTIGVVAAALAVGVIAGYLIFR